MYRDKDAADSGRSKPETKTTEVVDVDDIIESIKVKQFCETAHRSDCFGSFEHKSVF